MSVASTRTRVLGRERERDRATADADVHDARERHAGDECERTLDDDLGLGARHERARVGAQHEAPEAPLAEDVGERLARAASFEQRTCLRALAHAQRTVVLGVEL